MTNIEIYQEETGNIEVNVTIDDNNLWLNLNQLSELFERDKSVISRHLANIFKEGELLRAETVAFFATVQTEGNKTVERNIEYFNLDAIISVGYRVNSKRGTQFRKWATKVLNKHLIEGYTLNEKRLNEYAIDKLKDSINLLSNSLISHNLTNDIGYEIIKLIRNYSKTWTTLLQYDENRIETKSIFKKTDITFTYKDALTAIAELKKELLIRKEATDIFGFERNKGLETIIGNIEQSFDGIDLYKTYEEKAAHLLYFIIKDHPFTDGNKRIASLIFLIYLKKVGINLDKINDNTLIALALLIAEEYGGRKINLQPTDSIKSLVPWDR